mgnify:CR=1 FL=1
MVFLANQSDIVHEMVFSSKLGKTRFQNTYCFLIGQHSNLRQQETFNQLTLV